mmetsp:Transcript_22200/g.51666  ORF Transcript_22200/g.51666 Transcript_22200/m.51666 type:complete len:155 (+) Transcript_22200:78-542(+)
MLPSRVGTVRLRNANTHTHTHTCRDTHLRERTGIEGFQVLYTLLGLPPRQLSTKAQISKSYHRISLQCHPDKVRHLPEEEQEQASERFLSVKAAYELLLEGMENGGKGFGGPVFSAGDIEARFAGATGLALGMAAARASQHNDLLQQKKDQEKP